MMRDAWIWCLCIIKFSRCLRFWKISKNRLAILKANSGFLRWTTWRQGWVRQARALILFLHSYGSCDCLDFLEMFLCTFWIHQYCEIMIITIWVLVLVIEWESSLWGDLVGVRGLNYWFDLYSVIRMKLILYDFTESKCKSVN